MGSANKIFLIGMPGSGKSTVGRLLAEKLAMDFYDLDAEIELAQGRTIAEIFTKDGEEVFRKIEAETLLNAIAKKSDFVMATGGGTPYHYNGMKRLNEAGITFYLDTPIEMLITRTKRKQHRPLLGENHAEKMEILLSERQNCYLQANYVIKTADLGLSGKVEKIIKILAEQT